MQRADMFVGSTSIKRVMSLNALTVFIVNLSECIKGTNSMCDWISFLGAQKCARDDHST